MIFITGSGLCFGNILLHGHLAQDYVCISEDNAVMAVCLLKDLSGIQNVSEDIQKTGSAYKRQQQKKYLFRQWKDVLCANNKRMN